MKYLGVDFGEKKIGLAKSDSLGQMAFPLKILKNDENFEKKFFEILEDEKIEKIIFGKSLNFEMEENKIHKKLEKFLEKIKKKLEAKKIDWEFENEVLTSMEARRGQQKNERRVQKKQRIEKKIKKREVDDSAAALILKSYLDKENENFSF